MKAQKPAMHLLAGAPPSGGQQSAVVAQRSSRLAHICCGGEHVPTG